MTEPIRLDRISPAEYRSLFPDGAPGCHLYNSAPFIDLVAAKADEVTCYALSDTHIRAGIALGRRGEALRSPWSAPFGGLRFTRLQSVETLDRCVGALRRLGVPVEITLPPAVYFPELHGRLFSALLRVGRLDYADLSYHYDLSHASDFARLADRNARQKLREALRSPFTFEELDTRDPASLRRAYAVIAANRSGRGYPLAMSLDQVAETAPVAHTLAMVLRLGETDVAAAIVNCVTPRIAQIVYWGDTPGYSSLRPMNLLPMRVFEALGRRGFEIADLGPASSGGEPDYGLSTYKDSLGAVATVKPRFTVMPD